ncbi:MAG: GNAT family N-acetyltransferase [Pseudomonadota bacterium]
MIVRRFADGDRAAIAAIHSLSWQQSYREQMPPAFLDEELPSIMQQHWNNKIIREQDIVLVAEDNDKIIGFVAAWDGDPVYLDNLHVVEAYRSHGVGRCLMGETAIRARDNGRTAIDLHVVIGNDRAKALYLAMGGAVSAEENKDLHNIPVAHYRISWPDVTTLIEHTTQSRRTA